MELIKLLHSKNIPLAIASSSELKVISVVVDKLGIRNYIKVICSAEHEQFGKPNPAVYLTTAKKLGIKPENCLVFEDSPNGVLAAKAANMKCIAIPSMQVKKDPRFDLADKILDSLTKFNLRDLDTL